MSLAVDYDALEATTSIEDIAEDELNRDTLRRLLRDDNTNLSSLCLCNEFDQDSWPGDYCPGSSEELGWLGHFAKKSTHLNEFTFSGGDIFRNCSKQSVGRFFEDIGRCNHEKMYFTSTGLAEIIHKLEPIMKKDIVTVFSVEES